MDTEGYDVTNNEKRCCNTCKYMKKLIKWDYSGGGCKHSECDGFVCLACAFEGVAIHMVGADPDVGKCEMWMWAKF